MNQFNPNIHHRRSVRLKDYDYSQAGLYFVTICVQNKVSLFGNIINGEIKLNDAGVIVEKEWLKLPQRYNNIQLHEYVIMPNHFHAIIQIINPVGATLVVAQHDTFAQNDAFAQNDTFAQNDIKMQQFPNQGQPQGIAPTGKTIGDIIGGFKSNVTVEYIRGVKSFDWHPFNNRLWQRNYYEHIIRNEESYYKIVDYIRNNPSNWNKDQFYV